MNEAAEALAPKASRGETRMNGRTTSAPSSMISTSHASSNTRCMTSLTDPVRSPLATAKDKHDGCHAISCILEATSPSIVERALHIDGI